MFMLEHVAFIALFDGDTFRASISLATILFSSEKRRDVTILTRHIPVLAQIWSSSSGVDLNYESQTS